MHCRRPPGGPPNTKPHMCDPAEPRSRPTVAAPKRARAIGLAAGALTAAAFMVATLHQLAAEDPALSSSSNPPLRKETTSRRGSDSEHRSVVHGRGNAALSHDAAVPGPAHKRSTDRPALAANGPSKVELLAAIHASYSDGGNYETEIKCWHDACVAGVVSDHTPADRTELAEATARLLDGHPGWAPCWGYAPLPSGRMLEIVCVAPVDLGDRAAQMKQRVAEFAASAVRARRNRDRSVGDSCESAGDCSMGLTCMPASSTSNCEADRCCTPIATQSDLVSAFKAAKVGDRR